MNLKTFITGTIQDFKSVWETYPNVLIWSGVVGIILFIL
jgi:hypothetical protein